MIEESIVSALTGHAGLSALVGNRIYPKRAPQGAEFPHVVFFRVSGARHNNLDGENIQNPRFQVDSWAFGSSTEAYAIAKGVAAQVELAFKAASFTSLLIADRDDEDDGKEGVYGVSQDYSVWSV